MSDLVQNKDPNAPQRKNDHILICRDKPVEASDRFNGFSQVSIRPVAWPKKVEVDTKQLFLGKTFSAPLLVTGMTGGVEMGSAINHNLAEACESLGIPMGLGSQRIGIDDPKRASIFDVKSRHPRLFVIGNIGFSQLRTKQQASTFAGKLLRWPELTPSPFTLISCKSLFNPRAIAILL